MPYGLPKEQGGDTKENDEKMERCVRSVMSRKGVSKVSAIKICKSSAFPKKRGKP